MQNRLAVSLIALSLFVSNAAFAQSTTTPSTTAQGAEDGARTGGEVGGSLGAKIGGTVGAVIGAALEIPNAAMNAIDKDREPSVFIPEQVAVGETLPPEVVLRPVPLFAEYRYAVVNNQRVIVDPHTRRVIKIVE